ncbi:MAG: GAF domain-containing protein [Mycobacterium sp.]
MRRFDDRLNRLLEECAADVGEDVETYVTRAVARQMVAEQRRVSSESLEELLAHLADFGVFGEASTPSVIAAITDPDRLRALHDTGLLDSPPDAVYDRITRAAADALNAPHSAVSLVDADRQFFVSTAGMGAGSAEERQTPLERSICQYAVATGRPLILEDARLDPAFKNHAAVRDGSVVAYLGVPLIDAERNAIGTLCVFDTRPRLWGNGHVQVLCDLAQVAAERIFSARSSGR